MQLRRCTNAKCLRPYQIRKSENPAGESKSGKLSCPHCDHIEALWEDEAFSLQALTTEQEVAFNNQGLGEFPYTVEPPQRKQLPLAIRAILTCTFAKPFAQPRFIQLRKNH